jgi:putative PIN family toxin of toxin-antitoxin system
VKIVLDTNVLLSGLAYPNGTPGRIVAAWDNHSFDLIISHSQLREIARVLAYPKIQKLLRWDKDRIEEFIRQLLLRAEIVDPATVFVEVPGDPDDGFILANLIASGADLLITGDQALAALRDRHPIETPAAFLRRL